MFGKENYSGPASSYYWITPVSSTSFSNVHHVRHESIVSPASSSWHSSPYKTLQCPPVTPQQTRIPPRITPQSRSTPSLTPSTPHARITPQVRISSDMPSPAPPEPNGEKPDKRNSDFWYHLALDDDLQPIDRTAEPASLLGLLPPADEPVLSKEARRAYEANAKPPPVCRQKSRSDNPLANPRSRNPQDYAVFPGAHRRKLTTRHREMLEFAWTLVQTPTDVEKQLLAFWMGW